MVIDEHKPDTAASPPACAVQIPAASPFQFTLNATVALVELEFDVVAPVMVTTGSGGVTVVVVVVVVGATVVVVVVGATVVVVVVGASVVVVVVAGTVVVLLTLVVVVVAGGFIGAGAQAATSTTAKNVAVVTASDTNPRLDVFEPITISHPFA